MARAAVLSASPLVNRRAQSAWAMRRAVFRVTASLGVASSSFCFGIALVTIVEGGGRGAIVAAVGLGVALSGTVLALLHRAGAREGGSRER